MPAIRAEQRPPAWRWAQWLLVAIGAASLGYVVYSFADAEVFQAYESWRLYRATASSRQPSVAPPRFRPTASSTRAHVQRGPIVSGSALGRIEIARIGISVSIVAPPCSADNRYDAHSRQADLILTSTFSPILDPEAFLSQLLSHGQLGSALGSGLWTEPQFLARVRRAAAFTGSARRAAYRRLEQELLRAAPVAAFGSFYDGHYLSPRVGCRIVQEGANVIDLGMLCKRGTS